MKFLRYTLIGLAALIAILAAVGFALPSDYRLERSIMIDAPRDAVHVHVGDLEKWPAWSPWKDEDPTIVVTRGDRSTGVGAQQSWTGDSGAGELTLTESSPESGIVYDLIFDDAHKSVGKMQYKSEGKGTRVTWSMSGDHGMNPLGRYMGLMMDSWVGPMFERGLSSLKRVVESSG